METPTILIVDDEPINLSVLSEQLKPSYQVRACKSGAQAIQAANGEPRPDLILLDVMMPGMNGYAVLERLKEDEKTKDIPVIFISALNEEIDEENGLRLGAVDYISKPVRPAIMLARVRTHLEIKQSRDQLKNQNFCLEAEVTRRINENLLIQNVSLNVILELAETRDTDTGNHISRTQAYVEALARKLQIHPSLAPELNELNLARIVKAAPLHDIGKIGIPDAILLKPGQLTVEEFEIMKTHCHIGADALRRAMDKALFTDIGQPDEAKPESLAVLRVARVIATSHHEKWDGTGYPEGLAGNAIPLPARLMALADVYDALTSPRIYKKRWAPEKAAEYIQLQKGKHFDPEVVEAFESSQDAFENILRLLADSNRQ